MDRIELTIFRNLIKSKQFLQKAYPFLKREYFSDDADKALYDHISQFITKYNDNPTVENIVISLQNDNTIPETTYTNAVTAIYGLDLSQETNLDWLMIETETFCKTKALHNAILRSVSIIEGSDKELKPDALPSLLSDALSVCFDTAIGHDYLGHASERHDYYTRVENKLQFDIDYLNKITDGGVTSKTLSIILAGTGVGKSLMMCHLAAANVSAGKNVLYITLELSEKAIAQRIDANLLGVNIGDLKKTKKEDFMSRIDKLNAKTHGKLIVKEYPTSGVHVGHFKALLAELKVKKKFVPDVIYIDYINLCLSSRIRAGSGANSYTMVKAIAEEIRGMAVEFDVPIFSATQTVRSANGASDINMTDVSESFGLAATVDMLLGAIRTDELDENNQVMFKLLKSRFVDAATFGPFLLGVDRSKMRLYDLEKSAQTNISGHKAPMLDTVPAQNGTQFMGTGFKQRANTSKFEGFKV